MSYCTRIEGLHPTIAIMGNLHEHRAVRNAGDRNSFKNVVWSIPNVGKTVAGPSVSVWVGGLTFVSEQLQKVCLFGNKEQSFCHM